MHSGITGPRKTAPQGRFVMERLSRSLARHLVSVVAGLAACANGAKSGLDLVKVAGFASGNQLGDFGLHFVGQFFELGLLFVGFGLGAAGPFSVSGEKPAQGRRASSSTTLRLS
jgi:hypothetical protein